MIRQRIIVLTVVMISALIYWSGQKKSKVSDLTPSPNSAATTASHYLRQGRDFQGALAEKSKEPNSSIPPACADYFDQLEKIDLQGGSENSKMSYQILPNKPEGCTWKDDSLDLASAEFEKVCVNTPLEQKVNLSSSLSDACLTKLFFLRSAITRLLLKDRPISSISDAHQLVDLLFAEFAASASSKSPDFSRIKEASDRMLELDPHLYVAAKTSVYSGAIQGLMAEQAKIGSENQSKFNWQKVEADLARADRLNPADPSLDDARALIATHGFDPKKTLAYAENKVREFPETGRNYFLKGYAEWKLNQRPEAIADLKKAIALSPEHSEYPKLLIDLKKPEANADSYQGNFNFSVNESDFHN